MARRIATTPRTKHTGIVAAGAYCPGARQANAHPAHKLMGRETVRFASLSPGTARPGLAPRTDTLEAGPRLKTHEIKITDSHRG